ncbi:hypothetical protein ACFY6U_10430 [Streptomyces sp. NPDC013157]
MPPHPLLRLTGVRPGPRACRSSAALLSTVLPAADGGRHVARPEPRASQA